jgi:3-oxoacyl-[acyl-carrier-protein] synthase-3
LSFAESDFKSEDRNVACAVKAIIRDVSYVLPETVVTNDDLRREHPEWDLSRIEKRTGVQRRHLANATETALDLASRAAERLFEAHPGLRERVDAILFCTESADYHIPPNSCLLHGRLDLPESVFALDVDLGCSGYPYCLALARGLIAAGTASNILLVTADTYSKFIDPNDQAVRVLFGDAAAVSWITAGESGGIIDVQCGTAGKYYEKFIIRGGGCRASEETDVTANPTAPCRLAAKIQMDGASILAFSNAKIPPAINALLNRNGLTVPEIDLFLFHQASQVVLDSVSRLLRIDPRQEFSNLANVGNTVSASIPIALKDALTAGRLAPGNSVVLCGFGLGLSWSTMLLKWS